MGLQELMLLLILILFSFCSPASFAPTNLIPENTRENKGVNGINETNTTFGSNGAMANQSKYTTALRRAGGGGRSGGDVSQSNASPQGGGNGLVPVYAAAGAAGNRRNHKSGATTYTPCWKGGLAMLVATSAYLLMYIPI
ncbi:hypothetical protein HanRHA438_Chr05g0225541 [Helianthus annuus]|uniref:Uncharacterized protein n=1 Tax=Helianthus annuus TaxID=4232 RepID=A0A251UQS2_HELAN|nr:serine, glycine, tyrosine and glutamine-rich protein [Helianthus annuus]XP_035846453.1 serine, glycine, tyrosine and glutamine-rich protein [Helianthus annuus]KAF5806008.1 hypothetical protein HanXRQr2_Chr05g0216261 [Helianthus annuus]KAJ0577142.1 hypothetical protein HanIR_Chr05g0232631 [Helianthus annuus]KAJ0584681.1 hypothetical protein HanHA89_Chr05g0191531 [Helianthus annuus]KAJ0750348.1 hypothetical protein HanLR1_Chr05g0180961 [Helianthus annuus]KAJ0919084.1 hypothetical protein Han